MPTMTEHKTTGRLMGLQEIEKALGVSRQRVHQLAAHPSFPAAWDSIAAGRIWRSEDIAEWAAAQKRSFTPPQPTEPAEHYEVIWTNAAAELHRTGCTHLKAARRRIGTTSGAARDGSGDAVHNLTGDTADAAWFELLADIESRCGGREEDRERALSADCVPGEARKNF